MLISMSMMLSISTRATALNTGLTPLADEKRLVLRISTSSLWDLLVDMGPKILIKSSLENIVLTAP
ncbi:uncharacterized protein PHALS_09306 [Plasmopara halstedii]|uniref:RxLR-like protein n=1 Tax=Plasmopara halstedii TaxID=4781 RepID=A0A0P1AF63_PLAHL|nr:uncharacterized protein PHALS_09306 [Plasmopara halstedii]CEG39254.1 hypothetical protein PHALS_09306 [Plasmopara halstedii]|eukprot:XP_024575623.1 hypothetical protein PHALS_09306 [Plasmopara halstedii]